MDLRIRALTSLDPTSAPLPHGTEVTTRVDRVLTPERRIPQGAVALDTTLLEAERLAEDLDRARSETKLPAHPDVARADALLRRIAEETARRHLQAEPGPLGRDAPPPPEVAWDDGAPDLPASTESPGNR